jgi:glycosyltransferase involved in cell wall biosynthesis
LGIVSALSTIGIHLDFIGSNDVDSPELRHKPEVRFLNLRGDQREDAPFIQKAVRVLKYYVRLMSYAASSQASIFHILWNNKFELFDRTVLMLYYKLLGKRIVFTAHNVNAGLRDNNDTWVNRASLAAQYRLCDHIFVHTELMKRELSEGFGIKAGKVSVIPFGINNTVPLTSLTREGARQSLGLSPTDKAILFFGNIAAYKGLEYLIAAFSQLAKQHPDYRLIIAGQPKGDPAYWRSVQQAIADSFAPDRIIQRIEYVPDEQTELFFKAADVLVLPYTHIFQSGVLFLGYSFGLPVIATDVGSLKLEIVEGDTGLVCQPSNAQDLASAIEKFFSHPTFQHADNTRRTIQQFANDRYSWQKVAELTNGVYARLAR